MDWLGIGVLIIGIAFAILVIVLMKPISKLSNVLGSVQVSTDRLPEQVDTLVKQVTGALHTYNSTIENVNNQVHEISPVFQIVGDAGEASRAFTSSALSKVTTLKQRTGTAKNFSTNEKYEGIYGLVSFIFFMSQRKKEFEDTLPTNKK